MRDTNEILDELAGDFGTSPLPGDTSGADVDDDLRVIAEIHLDEVPASHYINDCDVWGKVSEFAYDYYHDGHTQRPKDFTGAARKLQVARGYWMWWEPWDGFLKLSPEDQRKEQEQVRWLLEVGFCGVTVKLLERLTDRNSGEHWVEIGHQGLWGIDSLENGYIRSVLSDLLFELFVYEEASCATSD